MFARDTQSGRANRYTWEPIGERIWCQLVTRDHRKLALVRIIAVKNNTRPPLPPHIENWNRMPQPNPQQAGGFIRSNGAPVRQTRPSRAPNLQ